MFARNYARIQKVILLIAMIDEKFQQELRTRFNPDGSLLRRHQLRMLEMLTYIDGVCAKYGIPYWLSSGTLLGAVRHGGFIPWDDDVDIELLRKDYKKLLRVLCAETDDRYRLQIHKTDKGYFFPFAKLRDTRSVLRENDDIDLGFRYRGIYIDIFPLEVNKYPLSKVLGRLQLGVQRLSAGNFGRSRLGRTVAEVLFGCERYAVWPLLRALYKLWPRNVLNHTFGVCFYKSRDLREVFPLKRIPFEEAVLSGPFDPDAYLRRIYGDYMTLPPLDRIAPHTVDVTLDEENR